MGFISIIEPYLSPMLSSDDFQEILLCCFESKKAAKGKKYIQMASKKIKLFFKERNAEKRVLYNSKKNISLDRCYGSERNSAHDWLKIPQLNERD